MSFTKLVSTRHGTVKNGYDGVYFRDYTVTGHLYCKFNRKFLWWRLPPKFWIKLYVPRIRSTWCDGQSITNQNLDMVAQQVTALLNEDKDNFNRRLIRMRLTAEIERREKNKFYQRT